MGGECISFAFHPFETGAALASRAWTGGPNRDRSRLVRFDGQLAMIGEGHEHGGAGEVIVVTHADDVRVLEHLLKQRIGASAVAIVSGPVLANR